MATAHVLAAGAGAGRLDRFLAESLPGLSRSHLKRLIEEGHVRVNGRAAKPSQQLREGDGVAVDVPDPEPLNLSPQAIPLAVVFEDQDVLVVDKPAGLTVHPGPGHPDLTLVNAVLAHSPDLGGIGGALRPGIVHRLDKDTSGLLMIAKNDAAQASLMAQIKDRTVVKRYVALVKGRLPHERGAIDAPIARDPRNRQRMAVVQGGREARTEYRVLRRLPGHTLAEATLVTGRTHQIRVHFSSIGHPVLGDPVYGGRSPLLGRQFLHASELAFTHPRTGKAIQCAAPLPADLREALETLTIAGQSHLRHTTRGPRHGETVIPADAGIQGLDT